ncbi:NUDIX domain-containing protein [Snodgrassella alvi]|uniref:8-oxo-dGTP diphosphatase n=1 Tax=Snodgrassella alvi TaxID=1196083 RepID=A0A2N9WTC6_9NEIS|nr:NUDIX domain-containing protein [Snodgrassella alvi]PIT14589.1 hypothetical protein BGI32_07085 [Snodgrassella alvi]PIT17079.1 hypothetical protein BGI34_08630 [Snodgrassella alvi]
MSDSSLIEVVAGILYNQQGEFLLSSRPAGKAYAGYWEFAGGKVEANESRLAALQREFTEELGIEVTTAAPWLTKIHRYEHAHVHLHFYRIAANQWHGQLTAREQQSWCWQKPGNLTVAPMLPANAPILAALAIPANMSGHLNTGFHTATPQQPALQILPYQPGIATTTVVYVPASQLKQLANQHPTTNIWAICHNYKQWLEAQTAAAIIWPIANSEDIQLLLTLLQQHPSGVPVMVLLEKSSQPVAQPNWFTLGVHGVIQEQ